MTAREDYPLLATAERLEGFGEAHRALDEIDRLREFIRQVNDECTLVLEGYLFYEVRMTPEVWEPIREGVLFS